MKIQKIQIKSTFGSVLFEGDFLCLTDAVKAAVKGRADLSGADLSGADLIGANLGGADLSGANLSRAYLGGANLSGADLSGANLSEAYLGGANLSGANLSRAYLGGADLSGADLSRANLSEAKHSELAIAMTRILPEGDIIGWKKCQKGVLVKLLIPAKAKRSNAFGRKCRAEYATVLQVVGAREGLSLNTSFPIVKYRRGDTVRPKAKFSLEWTEECASGIHFFITKKEAINFVL